MILIVAVVISWRAVVPKKYQGDFPDRAVQDEQWERMMYEDINIDLILNDNSLPSGNPGQAISEKSGISVRSPFESGGYWQLSGGLVDWIDGDDYSIELYGKNAVRWQNYRQWPLAWDDYVHKSVYDYFLLQRNKKTKEAKLLKEWRNTDATLGLIGYNKGDYQLLVILCGEVDREIIELDFSFYEHNAPPVAC